MYGPQAALIAECFTPRLRYSGASIGYQLSSIISGGPAPLIATALLAATGSGYTIAFYILFCAIVSIVATALMPDYTNQDISRGARQALIKFARARRTCSRLRTSAVLLGTLVVAPSLLRGRNRYVLARLTEITGIAATDVPAQASEAGATCERKAHAAEQARHWRAGF
jgi:hypothetical protein